MAWELTISARSAYVFGTDEVARPRALRAINEVQHRVTQTLLRALDGQSASMSSVVDAAMSFAAAGDCGDEVATAITNALRSYRSQGESSTG